MIRKASAVWQGDLKSGNGTMTAPSGVMTNEAYSFATRFEEKPGTNPEELIAAAHAGCFSMAFSAELSKAGMTPVRVETTAAVTLETVDGKPTVTRRAASNMECLIDQPSQFDFYDGGGLDLAFLGLAQVYRYGNINVSKFGNRFSGAGGFINISQNAKRVIFLGTFTANVLKVAIEDGKLRVLREGAVRKFVQEVEHRTFSGDHAIETGQPVLYVTERAVFELSSEGLVLTEVAPGINIQHNIRPFMDFLPVIRDRPKEMDARIFRAELMGIGAK